MIWLGIAIGFVAAIVLFMTVIVLGLRDVGKQMEDEGY